MLYAFTICYNDVVLPQVVMLISPQDYATTPVVWKMW